MFAFKQRTNRPAFVFPPTPRGTIVVACCPHHHADVPVQGVSEGANPPHLTFCFATAHHFFWTTNVAETDANKPSAASIAQKTPKCHTVRPQMLVIIQLAYAGARFQSRTDPASVCATPIHVTHADMAANYVVLPILTYLPSAPP